VVENDALKAERSRSHSLAATWTPTDTFSLSLTHNIVELRNEILALQPADAVWNRGTWELDEDGHLSSLRLSFDNIGRTTSRNWVLRGEYRIDTGSTGQWLFSLDALKQQELRRDVATMRRVDLRGHVTPTMAAVLNVQWQNSNWDIALRGNQVGARAPGCPARNARRTARTEPLHEPPAAALEPAPGTPAGAARRRRAGRAQRARHATGELPGRQWWADAGAGRSTRPLLPADPAVPLSVVPYAPCSIGPTTP
jgi:hypothetical protein